MADVLSPQLGFKELQEGQAGAEVRANEALIALDGFAQLSFKSRTTTAQPGSPTEGDRYLIPSGATGTPWSSNVGKVTIYIGGQWVMYTPKEGWLAWVDSENVLLRYDGTNWVQVSLAQQESKSIAIYNPSASENLTMFFTAVAITIKKTVAVIRGATSVTYQVKHDTSRAGTGNNLYSSGQTGSSTTTGDIVTSGFNDATIPANSFVWLTTSAVSGAPTEFALSLFFTED